MSAKLSTILIVILVLQSNLSSQVGLRPGETVRESDRSFPGVEPIDEDGNIQEWVFRVVDSLTGRPIPTAVVRVPHHRESSTTPSDLFYRCHARPDDDGWIRIAREDVEGYIDYILADADGYAPFEQCEPGSTQVVLQRGVDVPFVLLDYVGDPVSGARVGYNLGCDHIPDQRHAVTDAQGRGVFLSIFPGRHEDVFVESPGIHFGAMSLAGTWTRGSAPVEIHAPPAIVVEGRVLKEDGRPWQGARVGPSRSDRPWSLTDSNGSFRLVGVSPWSEIRVETPERKVAGKFIAPPHGTRVEFRRGTEPKLHELRVTLKPEGDRSLQGVRVSAVRLADGWTVTERCNEAGVAVLEVAEGPTKILVDGELGDWGKASSVATVKSDESIEIALPANPGIRIDASGLDHHTVGLTTKQQYRVISKVQLAEGVVPIPLGERATFRISKREEGELLVRFIDIPAVVDSDTDPIVLDWFPATTVRAELVGPDGAAVSGNLVLSRTKGGNIFGSMLSDASLSPEATTRLLGRLEWIITPERKDLAPVQGSLNIERRGGVLDLGLIRLEEFTPSLTVEAPGQGRLNIHHVKTSANYQAMSNHALVDGRAELNLRHLAEGDRLRIETVAEKNDELPSLTANFVIEGPPPWKLRVPSGRLSIEVLDIDSKAVEDPAIIINGEFISWWLDTEGRITITGMPEGPVELIVAHRGFSSKFYELQFRDGEQRSLQVELERAN